MGNKSIWKEPYEKNWKIVWTNYGYLKIEGEAIMNFLMPMVCVSGRTHFYTR